MSRLWLDEGLPRANGQSLNHLQVCHQEGSWCPSNPCERSVGVFIKAQNEDPIEGAEGQSQNPLAERVSTQKG